MRTVDCPQGSWILWRRLGMALISSTFLVRVLLFPSSPFPGFLSDSLVVSHRCNARLYTLHSQILTLA